MQPSLFRGKKGQFADVVGGFQRVINWFLTTAPKPLLIIIFLLFILGFSAIFSVLLNTTGNFCDTNGNEYKTNTFSLLTNVRLITIMPNNDELDITSISPRERTLIESTVLSGECSPFISNYFYLDNGVRINVTEGNYFLGKTRCIECDDPVMAYPYNRLTLEQTPICLDSIVRPKSYDDKGWLGKQICGNGLLSGCSIPEGYYYDREQDLFICESDLCNITGNGTSTSIGKIWNLKLLEKGAKIKNPSTYGDKDYRNAISVECDVGDVNPKLRLFGIEIFNYKLWVFLIILSGLVWFLFKIKK